MRRIKEKDDQNVSRKKKLDFHVCGSDNVQIGLRLRLSVSPSTLVQAMELRVSFLLF